jgi:hypothetical protein
MSTLHPSLPIALDFYLNIGGPRNFTFVVDSIIYEPRLQGYDIWGLIMSFNPLHPSAWVDVFPYNEPYLVPLNSPSINSS